MKWSQVLPTATKELGNTLAAKAQTERDKGLTLYPSQNKIFRALELTAPDEIKVVIVGQDPYHEEGQAHGLSFSVEDNCAFPPSLKNIFNELVSDVHVDYPQTGNLTSWARQGVLLLNSTLTVYEHQANSCASWGWRNFTQDILRSIVALPQPIVIILWGAFAQDLMPNLITSSLVYPRNNISVALEPDVKKAFVLSSHPSPLSASKSCRGTPPFKGSKPFSTTNELLISMGSKPINWNVRPITRVENTFELIIKENNYG